MALTKAQSTLALATLLMSAVGPVQAAWAASAQVQFNDLAAGQLAGQFGGSGFSPAEPWGNSAAVAVQTGDLIAPAATQFDLVQPGVAQCVQSASGAAVQSTRALDQPLSGTVWFSFLLNQPNSTARGGITFNANTTTAAVLPRVVAVGSSLFIDYGSDAQDLWLSNVLTFGETALILGRIELDVAGAADRLSLWINPNVAAPGSPDALLEGNDAFGGALSRIGLASYHLSGTVGGVLDLVSIADGPTAYAAVTGSAGGGYTLTFADEFNQPGLDSAAWVLDTERSNVEVAGGLLRLVTTADGADWFTGKISSHFTQRFGYYEARYRIGADTGLNNAFWLSTPDDIFAEPGGAPQTVDRTEVDINETHYPDELNMTLHDWSPVHVGVKHRSVDVGGNLSASFHTYAFEWHTDNRMTWYFDGLPYLTASAAEVNGARTSLPLTVLFSTKVLPFAGEPGPNLDGTSMDVDYVRVYQKQGWTGAVSAAWSEPANWGADGVPAQDGAAVFNGPTTHPILTFSSDVSLREVYIAGAATPGMTFSAGQTLTLGDVSSADGVSSITLNSDVAQDQTFDLPIVGIRDLIIANYSRAGARLVLNGSINGLAPGRHVHFGGGAIDVNAAVGGNIANVILFAGADTRLAAANNHTGETDVRGGTLTVAAQGALGVASSTALTRVARGAALALADGVQYALAEPLYLAGTGAPVADGALTVADASAVSWNTNVWLEADTTISSGNAGGTLTIAGLVNSPDATSRKLTLAGNGTLQLGGILGTRVVGLRKTGTGEAVLLSASNLHAGTTTVEEGVLALGPNGSAGQSVFIDVQSDGTVDVSARPTGHTVAAGRTLRVDGAVVGGVTLASGATLKGQGTLHGLVTAQGGATIRVGSGGAVQASPGNRNAAASLTLADGLQLQGGARIALELGNPGMTLRVSGGALTGGPSFGITLEIANAEINTSGVFTLMDWQGATALGVEPADFVVEPAIPGGALVVADDQLLLVRLTNAERFDFDHDGDVDAADATVFLAALAGPGIPVPPVVTTVDFVRADSDSDGDVDLADFAAFQQRFHP